jgi:glucose/arabinose dehydrogenase
MFYRRLGTIAFALALSACSRQAPPPPVVQPPPTAVTVTGTERLGWDQPAADAVELGTFQYAIYIDGVRSVLSGVTCANTSTPVGFLCSVPVPSMSLGAHTLEVAAFVDSGGSIVESARSAALQVRVVTPGSTNSLSQGAWPSDLVVNTVDGVTLRVELLAEGLNRPTDMAIAPDGRVFVTEKTGRLKVLRDNSVVAASIPVPAEGSSVVALALDPAFGRTHFVYLLGVSPTFAGRATYWLGRFREIDDSLVDRVVLLDGLQASSTEATGALRFGEDGKLYAAFDDGGDPRLAGDFASSNGKVLRLNADGTTPADQAGLMPLYAYPFHAPRGLDRDPASGVLWAADAPGGAAARLNVITPGPRSARRGTIATSYELPVDTAPSSLAFYRGRLMPAFRGSLFVASEEGHHLLRLRIDPTNPTFVVSTERMLQDKVGGLRAVASGSDGKIYFSTTTAIGRLTPVP